MFCLQPGSQEKVWAWSRKEEPKDSPFLSLSHLPLLSPAVYSNPAHPHLCSNLEPECLIRNRKTEADMGHLKCRFLPQPHTQTELTTTPPTLHSLPTLCPWLLVLNVPFMPSPRRPTQSQELRDTKEASFTQFCLSMCLSCMLRSDSRA